MKKKNALRSTTAPPQRAPPQRAPAQSEPTLRELALPELALPELALPELALPQPVQLAQRMSIAQCGELHGTLRAWLASGAPLLIEGGSVEQIDTAILQLLVSAWLGATKRGIECRWQGASQALRRSASLIGVAEILQLDGPQAA